MSNRKGGAQDIACDAEMEGERTRLQAKRGSYPDQRHCDRYGRIRQLTIKTKGVGMGENNKIDTLVLDAMRPAEIVSLSSCASVTHKVSTIHYD